MIKIAGVTIFMYDIYLVSKAIVRARKDSIKRKEIRGKVRTKQNII